MTPDVRQPILMASKAIAIGKKCSLSSHTVAGRFSIAPRLLLEFVMLAVGIGIGAGVTALAIPADPDVHACVANNTGTARIVSATARCYANEHAVEWSITGPQGPQGPQGDPGPAGPAGPQCLTGAAGAIGATGATAANAIFTSGTFTASGPLADSGIVITSLLTGDAAGGIAPNQMAGSSTYLGAHATAFINYTGQLNCDSATSGRITSVVGTLYLDDTAGGRLHIWKFSAMPRYSVVTLDFAGQTLAEDFLLTLQRSSQGAARLSMARASAAGVPGGARSATRPTTAPRVPAAHETAPACSGRRLPASRRRGGRRSTVGGVDGGLDGGLTGRSHADDGVQQRHIVRKQAHIAHDADVRRGVVVGQDPRQRCLNLA